MRVSCLKNTIASPHIFAGLRNPDTPSLFVFDLDGTLSKANQKDLCVILKKAEQSKGKVVYATGRTLNGYKNFECNMLKRGVYLPKPDYLIAKNGQYLYENIDGRLVPEENYTADYIFQKEEQCAETPDFTAAMTALYMLDVNKADGIEYLRKINAVEYKDLLMAGNDENDIPMAKLSRKGAKFIYAGKNSGRLADFCKNQEKNVYAGINSSGEECLLKGIEHFTAG